jgi:hypothetical protein
MAIQEKSNHETICLNRMELIMLIESLRSELERIVTLQQNYTDPKVLVVSQKLDKAISELYFNYRTYRF